MGPQLHARSRPYQHPSSMGAVSRSPDRVLLASLAISSGKPDREDIASGCYYIECNKRSVRACLRGSRPNKTAEVNLQDQRQSMEGAVRRPTQHLFSLRHIRTQYYVVSKDLQEDVEATAAPQNPKVDDSTSKNTNSNDQGSDSPFGPWMIARRARRKVVSPDAAAVTDDHQLGIAINCSRTRKWIRIQINVTH